MIPTPREIRRISNLAHSAEGIILLLAAVIAVIQSFGLMDHGRETLAWPGLISFAGLALLIYMLAPHHGMDHAHEQWRFVFGDDQQRQHLLIALLGFHGASVELLHRAGTLPDRWWAFVWPGSLLVVGLIFVLHAQHGRRTAVKRAVIIHRLLGLFLIGFRGLRGLRPVSQQPRIGRDEVGVRAPAPVYEEEAGAR